MSISNQIINNNINSNKLIIGLTGGIGSGKTLATDWFSKQNIDIIDADVIAHQIVEKGSETLIKIQEKFGDWVLTTIGELNRKAIREHVFQDSNALIDLEEITHPAIRQEAQQQLGESTSDYVIISAPLLLEAREAGLANLCNHIIVIDVPEDIQLKRASQRDGQTVEKIKAIMANQLSREARNSQADSIILNDGTVDDLYKKLVELHDKFLKMTVF